MSQAVAKPRNERNEDAVHKIEAKLKEKLTTLQNKTGWGHHLSVHYTRNPNLKLDGKIEDNAIFIYADEDKASSTLTYEFIEAMIADHSKPQLMLIDWQKLSQYPIVFWTIFLGYSEPPILDLNNNHESQVQDCHVSLHQFPNLITACPTMRRYRVLR